ncbi:MAG: hypothetical protein ACLFS5_11480, partial [Spirochaetaceae bacterium]
ISKKLAEMMGGEITVESVYVQPSGTFRFSGLDVSETDGDRLLTVRHGSGSINVSALLLRRLELRRLDLAGVDLELESQADGTLDPEERVRRRSSPQQPRWTVKLEDITLSEVDFTFGDALREERSLKAEGVSLSMDTAEFTGEEIRIDISRFAARSLEGVRVDHGELAATLRPRELQVERLSLEEADVAVDELNRLLPAPPPGAGDLLGPFAEAARITATGTAGGSRLFVDSDILHGDFSSELSFPETARELRRRIPSGPALSRRPISERVAGNIALRIESPESPELLPALVPGLEEISPFSARVSLDGARESVRP